MARSYQSELPNPVRMRALSLGEEGRQWLAALDDFVRQLAGQWQIEIGAVLSGGSESLVALAQLADGRESVLKIGLPGSSDLVTEAKVLRLAAGQGYAALIEHDADHNAMLVERLGSRLSSKVHSTEGRIRAICNTLQEAWIPLDSAHGLMTGAQKAAWLATFINEKWRFLGYPCDKETVERALAFAEERADAYSPANSVLVHGDAHAENTLLAAGVVNHEETPRYKFIDPDGLFAEKACDLAAIMRDWSHELVVGETLRLCQERCDLLAELTGVDAHAIWQWGFVERVSTGLVLLEIGLKSEGLEILAVADRIRRA